jgi:hypothetical protein
MGLLGKSTADKIAQSEARLAAILEDRKRLLADRAEIVADENFDARWNELTATLQSFDSEEEREKVRLAQLRKVLAAETAKAAEEQRQRDITAQKKRLDAISRDADKLQRNLVICASALRDFHDSMSRAGLGGSTKEYLLDELTRQGFVRNKGNSFGQPFSDIKPKFRPNPNWHAPGYDPDLPWEPITIEPLVVAVNSLIAAEKRSLDNPEPEEGDFVPPEPIAALPEKNLGLVTRTGWDGREELVPGANSPQAMRAAGFLPPEPSEGTPAVTVKITEPNIPSPVEDLPSDYRPPPLGPKLTAEQIMENMPQKTSITLQPGERFK